MPLHLLGDLHDDVLVADLQLLCLTQFLAIETRYELVARGSTSGGGGSSRPPRRRIGRFTEAGRLKREAERQADRLAKERALEISKLGRSITGRYRADTAAAEADRKALARFFRGTRPSRGRPGVRSVRQIRGYTWRRRIARLEQALSPVPKARVAQTIVPLEARFSRPAADQVHVLTTWGLPWVRPLDRSGVTRAGEYANAIKKLIRTRDFEGFSAEWKYRNRNSLRTTLGTIKLETDPKKLQEFIDSGVAEDLDEPIQYIKAEAAAA
jgi:hypothetical protein